MIIIIDLKGWKVSMVVVQLNCLVK